MKIKVRNQEVQEPVLELWLEQNGDKVHLIGKSSNMFKSCYIATVLREGIHLSFSVSGDIGLPLDAEGRVKVI